MHVLIVILQPVLGGEQECTVFAIKVARKGNNQEFLVVLSPILRLPNRIFVDETQAFVLQVFGKDMDLYK